MSDEQKPSENEKFYDEHIAPVLAELAKKCHEKNMPFLAMVGDQKDNFTTKYVNDWQNPAIRIAYYALKCQGNIDALMMMVEQDAVKYGGDNSIYLHNLKHYRDIINRGKL